MRFFTTVAMAAVISCGTAAADETVIEGALAFQAMQKTTCGTTEQGKTRFGIWEGRTFSRVPGEKDRLLFDVMGINVRQCIVLNDPVRGRGYRSVSREIMVYMEPDSGEILDTWENPWTGETVKVLHVANDPVNMRAPRYERDEEGELSARLTLRQYGELSAASYEIPLFYDNPLGGDYQAYVGGSYHAMEIFNSFIYTKNLHHKSVKSIGQSHMTRSRVSQWLQWLEMGSRPGLMIFNASGFSTFEADKIPERLQEILAQRYPLYQTPPPLDDPRPNETSWTVCKKYIEQQSDGSEG